MSASELQTSLTHENQSVKSFQDFDAISHQVQCDVDFLENRLKIMRAQHNPNQPVIRTYEDMLRSRLTVLDRLRASQDEHHINQKVG